MITTHHRQKHEKIVNDFNQSHSDNEKNSLCEQLIEINERMKTCADEFLKDIRDAVDDFCGDMDNVVVENLKQKVLSPFDTSADESRYNRINRLKDLDEYVDTQNKVLCQ